MGNTADCTTLEGIVEKIQAQYGRAQRIWVMNRGIPSEAVLEKLRTSAVPVRYLVGTPKGDGSQALEASLWGACPPPAVSSWGDGRGGRHAMMGPGAHHGCRWRSLFGTRRRGQFQDPSSTPPAA